MELDAGCAARHQLVDSGGVGSLSRQHGRDGTSAELTNLSNDANRLNAVGCWQPSQSPEDSEKVIPETST